MSSIGIIEVVGLTAAIEALDAMVKTSDVKILTCEKKLGGRLVTIIIQGEVSAVNEALEHGKKSANSVGKAVASAVIPNPHSEVMKMVDISAKKLNKVKSGEMNEF